MRQRLKLAIALVLVSGAVAMAQTEPVATDSAAAAQLVAAAPAVAPPAPVTGLEAVDTDNDHGHAITLTWTKSADDGAGAKSVLGYKVERWFPFQMDTVDSLRRDLAATRDAVRAFRIELPVAMRALEELREDPGKLGSIRFEVAVPDDSGFTLTTEYAIKKLEDTIAYMRDNRPLLMSRIKPMQKELEASLEHLPQAHAAYPQNGEWRLVGLAPEEFDLVYKRRLKGANRTGFLPRFYRSVLPS